MKKLLITALIGLFVLGVSGTASAVVLAPGGFSATGGVAVPAGGPVTTITLPIAYDSISGSVTQDVFFNATGYLFVYQFTNFETSTNAIGRMTATDYKGFFTNVDAALGTGFMPVTLDRSLSGDTVGFGFTPPGAVAPGKTTAKLWIQTDAQFYGPGKVNFINGGVQTLGVFGPAIPEPMSMMLLGLGTLGLFGLKRRRA